MHGVPGNLVHDPRVGVIACPAVFGYLTQDSGGHVVGQGVKPGQHPSGLLGASSLVNRGLGAVCEACVEQEAGS